LWQAALVMAAMLVLVWSGATMAKVEWSVKPVSSFEFPEGNIIPNGDLSEDTHRFTITYEWGEIFTYDTSAYLTGKSSLLFDQKEGQRGRVYVNVRVDSDKKYKLGYVMKTEDLKLPENNQSLRWGVYMQDGLGAWIDSREPLKSLPDDYLNGMETGGIVIRTPNEIDLGDGPKPVSGTTGWFNVEILLDLPALVKDLQAALGRINLLRVDVTLYGGSGKIWLDCIYLVPVED